VIWGTLEPFPNYKSVNCIAVHNQKTETGPVQPSLVQSVTVSSRKSLRGRMTVLQEAHSKKYVLRCLCIM
jgi:hypothetical protein